MSWFKRKPKKIAVPEDKILGVKLSVTLSDGFIWHVDIGGYECKPVAPGTVEMANAMVAGLHAAGYPTEVEITSGSWEKTTL